MQAQPGSDLRSVFEVVERRETVAQSVFKVVEAAWGHSGVECVRGDGVRSCSAVVDVLICKFVESEEYFSMIK